MQALYGLSPTLIAIISTLIAARLLLSTLTNFIVVLIAIMTTKTNRAARAERILGILIKQSRRDGIVKSRFLPSTSRTDQQ